MLAATSTAVFSTLLFNRNLLQTSTKLLINQNNSLKISSVRNLVAESAAKNLEHDKLFKRIDLELRGHDPEVLSSYTTFVSVSFNIFLNFSDLILLGMFCFLDERNFKTRKKTKQISASPSWEGVYNFFSP